MTTAHPTRAATPAAHPMLAPPWNERLALGVFVAYLAVAAVVIVRSFSWMWFLSDDWGMIDGRDALSIDGLLAAQNGHPSTVPVLVFGTLYRIVGLRSYLPYLGATLALHLTLALLLRVVMRRAGVGPWIATITAGTFVLFGTGWQNMVMAIQVSMVASMVFGVAQLILADHDGPFERRDVLALLAGLVALFSSSVGITMVVIVGIAVLIRRGPRMAAIQTAPLAATYLLWRLFAPTIAGSSPNPPPVGAGQFARWLGDALPGIFVSHAQFPIAAAALAVLLVGGLVLAWVPLDRAELRRRAAAPLALLLGAVVLTATIATQRAGLDVGGSGGLARSSRYMAMGVALVLPAIAVAADAVIRRWRLSTPIVVVILLVGVPGNIAALDLDDLIYNETVMAAQEELVTAAANSPLVGKVPGDARIDPSEFFTANLTAGFLAHARSIGRIGDAADVQQATREIADTRLALGQSAYGEPPPPHTCAPTDGTIEISPDVGDQFVIRAPVTVQRRTDNGGLTWPVTFRPIFAGETLRVQVPDTTFRIAPVAPATTFTWCTVP